MIRCGRWFSGTEKGPKREAQTSQKQGKVKRERERERDENTSQVDAKGHTGFDTADACLYCDTNSPKVVGLHIYRSKSWAVT